MPHYMSVRNTSLAKLSSELKELKGKLGESGKFEVRAKTIGNQKVLYVAPRGSFVQRKLENLFSGRQGKLEAARECIREKLIDLPANDRDYLMSQVKASRNSIASVGTALVAARDAEPANFLEMLDTKNAGPMDCRQVASALHAIFKEGSGAVSQFCKIDMVRTMMKDQGPGKSGAAEGTGVKASRLRAWNDLSPRERDRLAPAVEKDLPKVQSMSVDDWMKKLAHPKDPAPEGEAFSAMGKKLIALCKTDLQNSVEAIQAEQSQYRMGRIPHEF